MELLEFVVLADMFGRFLKRVDERRLDEGVRCFDLSTRYLEGRDIGTREGFCVAGESRVALGTYVGEDSAHLPLYRHILAEQDRVLLADGGRQFGLTERFAFEQRAPTLVGTANDPQFRYSFIARRARDFAPCRYSCMRS